MVEFIFLLDFILNFFVEYAPDCLDDPPIREFKVISNQYLKGNFMKEFIPLIPLQLVNLHSLGTLFYLIKLLRLPRGLTLLNVQKFLRIVKGSILEFQQKNNKNNDE